MADPPAAECGLTPVPACLPFTVDTWGPNTNDQLQFLTHAHKDHTAGVDAHATHVAATPTTLALLRNKFPALGRRMDAGLVRATPIGEHETLELTAAAGYGYSVTALPLANHCAGAGRRRLDIWGDLRRLHASCPPACWLLRCMHAAACWIQTCSDPYLDSRTCTNPPCNPHAHAARRRHVPLPVRGVWLHPPHGRLPPDAGLR
jgi:hypothetical protein